MEKFKKRVSAILVIGIIAFVAGFAMLSQNLSHVSRVSAEEKNGDIVASLSLDGGKTETTYAIDNSMSVDGVDAALAAIPDNSNQETTILKILKETYVVLHNMSNKNFTLDLNGKALTSVPGGNTIENAKFLLKDTSEDSSGDFQFRNSNSIIMNGCEITILSGKITKQEIGSSGYSYPAFTLYDNNKVTVDGGSLDMSVFVQNDTSFFEMTSGYTFELKNVNAKRREHIKS